MRREPLVEQVREALALTRLASTRSSSSRIRSTSRATAAPPGAWEYVKPWTNPPAPITASWIAPDAATNPNGQ
jgi:hypothetical protein